MRLSVLASCMHHEEGYLLPTIARKITCIQCMYHAYGVRSVACYQGLSFQGWRLHCMLYFIQYFSEFEGNESL